MILKVKKLATIRAGAIALGALALAWPVRPLQAESPPTLTGKQLLERLALTPDEETKNDPLQSLSSRSSPAAYRDAVSRYVQNGQHYSDVAIDSFRAIRFASPEASSTAIRAVQDCINGFYSKRANVFETAKCFDGPARRAFGSADGTLVNRVILNNQALIASQDKAWIAQDWCEKYQAGACDRAQLEQKIGAMIPSSLKRPPPGPGPGGEGGKKPAAPAKKTAPKPALQETIDGGSGGDDEVDGEGKPGAAGIRSSAPTAPPPPRQGVIGSPEGRAGGDANSRHRTGSQFGFDNAQPIPGAKAPIPFDSVDRCEEEAKRRKASGVTAKGSPCIPDDATPGITNLQNAFGQLGLHAQAQDQRAKLKLAVSRLRLQQYAESYLKVLSRRQGMSSMEYKRKMRELVDACAGPDAGTLKNDLAGLIAPLEPEVDAAQFENGRRAYSAGAMQAATELQQYDDKIKTLMGDFPQAPEEMLQHYPPFMPCRTVVAVLSQYESAFSKLGSRAECGSWRGTAFGGRLETCNLESEDLAPAEKERARAAVYTDYTPADRLLVEMKVVNPEAQGKECFAARCEKKKAILEALSVKRAEILSRFPELAYNTQPDGKLIETQALGGLTGSACGLKSDLDYWDKKLPGGPSAAAYLGASQAMSAHALALKGSAGYRQKYEGLKQACASDKPVYQHLNNRPAGKDAVEIFDRHLQGNMIAKELEANLGRIKSICKDPLAEAEESFKDDAALNNLLACDPQAAADASPAWKEVAARQGARCAEIKRDPKLACETREATRSAPAEKLGAAGAVAFEVGMTYMDLTSCFNLAGGLAKGFARAAAGESAGALAKDSGAAIVNGLKGLNPAAAIKTIATGGKSLGGGRNLVAVAQAAQQLVLTQGMFAHGVISAVHADQASDRALADCTAGILDGDACQAATRAAKDAWNGAIRDFALGMLVPALEAPGHAGGHARPHGVFGDLVSNLTKAPSAAPGPHDVPLMDAKLHKLYEDSRAHPQDPARRARFENALGERIAGAIGGGPEIQAVVKQAYTPEDFDAIAAREKSVIDGQKAAQIRAKLERRLGDPKARELIHELVDLEKSLAGHHGAEDTGRKLVSAYERLEALEKSGALPADRAAAMRRSLDLYMDRVVRGALRPGETAPVTREARLARFKQVLDAHFPAPKVAGMPPGQGPYRTPAQASPEAFKAALTEAHYRPEFEKLGEREIRALATEDRRLVEKFSDKPAVLEYLRDQNLNRILEGQCK